MKKHNFNPGPSILPQYTIDETVKAIQNFSNTDLSLLEVSHRSKEFDAVMDETKALFKELLTVPEGYGVAFVGGGASTQFFHIPYNFLAKKAAYVNTGEWASRAIKEAKVFGEVDVIASSEDKNFSYIPKGYTIPKDADYLHLTSNNTIFGTELLEDINSPIPLISDMSSDIFSRPLDVSKYAMIYGGAQKNLAPAGLTFVIVREDFLGKAPRPLPTMVDYRTHIKNNSMYNTPPCVVVYSALMTLRWLKNLGGVAAMEKRNIEKANLLYSEIDRNKLFRGTVAKEDRSRMNVCFVMASGSEQLEEEFLNFAKGKALVGLKGHRSVGGFRASLYNALPLESVQLLVDTMKEFEAAH
ncbi:MAG: 3-phosphoserine/phosphohydroxythreonine transaminase [Anaerolineaceae bacterium]|nr:3-phosphoserine/phosphohydroxythreonine transaminase [Anaerolineaceae bacterium]